MDTFIKLTLLLSGSFMVMFSLTMQTKNLVSSLVFRVIPFVLGLACLLSTLYVFGWLIKF